MKPATFKLDRHVYKLLKDGDLQQFTTRSLRDAYAHHLDRSANDVELWRYIYDQLQRLKRIGWVTQDPTKRKRDQVFHVADMPSAITLQLVEPHFPSACGKTHGVIANVTSPHKHPDGCSKQRLELLAKEIRLDMLTALGEAERYKQLFTEMPTLKARVEDDYLEARDRSSRLLGHLRAVENTLKLLVAV